MSIRESRWGLGPVLVSLLVACSSGSGGGSSGVAGSGGDVGNAGAGGTSAGGTGGAGATGGEGGTGGTGPVCDPACAPGEACVDRDGGPRCECTDDSCPDGQFCNEGHWCEPDWPVGDFIPCNHPEQLEEREDGARFFCTSLFHPDGLNRWLRICGAPEDCAAPHHICLGELLGYNVAPYCMTNRCGFDSLGPQLDPPRPGNGQPFGPCSATSGYLDEGTVADGTCYPQTFADATVGGVCVRTGAVPKTRACRVDAEFDEPMYLCAPDSICFAYGADAPRRPCSRDVECVGIPRTIDNRTELVDGYCAKDGACQAWGFCGDVCNSGYDGAAAHENAGCTDPDAVCIYPGGIPSLMREYPVLEGFCESHCRMFDPQTCPEFPSGVARACSPSFEADDPLGGTCIDQLASDKMIGDVCEHAPDATECPTGSACLTLSTGEPPRCLQWCECEAGFDGSTHVCRDEAANAGCGTAGDACVVAVPFSPVGLCATRG